MNSSSIINTTILLHICCAPCGAPSLERLQCEGKQVVLFYSNANINTKEEHDKRLAYVKKLAEELDAEVIEDSWDHREWLEAVKGLEKEPEGGARCDVCFAFNLERAKRKADELGIEAFTTTLTLSPHKNSKKIFQIAEVHEGFVEENFKKREGFKRSIELSRELGLYRQSWCGCEFSLAESKSRKEKSDRDF